MICPKCGFEQEDRPDCKKCGLVLSKFKALYPQGKPVGDETVEKGGIRRSGNSAAEELEHLELPQVQRLQRDLNRLSNEFEFERAERNRLRGEIRMIEQKILDDLKGVSEKVEKLESSIPASHHSVTQEVLSAIREQFPVEGLGQFLERLDRLEEHTNTLAEESVVKTELRILERIQGMESRIAELESKPAGTSEASEKEGGLDPVLELGKVLNELDLMRTSLQNVTIRYSEIGDMKKNHLILSNSLDSLVRDVGVLKEEASQGISKRIDDANKEVTALRAEVRQMLKEMGTAGADSSVLQIDVQSVKEALQALVESRAGDEAKHQSAQAALEARLGQVFAKMRELEEKLSTGSAQPTLKAAPAQDDEVRTIRENLEDIRRFMVKLSQKL